MEIKPAINWFVSGKQFHSSAVRGLCPPHEQDPQLARAGAFLCSCRPRSVGESSKPKSDSPYVNVLAQMLCKWPRTVRKRLWKPFIAPFCPILEYGMDPIPLFALLSPKPRSCEQSGKVLSQHPNRNDHLRDGTCTWCWESDFSFSKTSVQSWSHPQLPNVSSSLLNGAESISFPHKSVLRVMVLWWGRELELGPTCSAVFPSETAFIGVLLFKHSKIRRRCHKSRWKGKGEKNKSVFSPLENPIVMKRQLKMSPLASEADTEFRVFLQSWSLPAQNQWEFHRFQWHRS